MGEKFSQMKKAENGDYDEDDLPEDLDDLDDDTVAAIDYQERARELGEEKLEWGAPEDNGKRCYVRDLDSDVLLENIEHEPEKDKGEKLLNSIGNTIFGIMGLGDREK